MDIITCETIGTSTYRKSSRVRAFGESGGCRFAVRLSRTRVGPGMLGVLFSGQHTPLQGAKNETKCPILSNQLLSISLNAMYRLGMRLEDLVIIGKEHRYPLHAATTSSSSCAQAPGGTSLRVVQEERGHPIYCTATRSQLHLERRIHSPGNTNLCCKRWRYEPVRMNDHPLCTHRSFATPLLVVPGVHRRGGRESLEEGGRPTPSFAPTSTFEIYNKQPNSVPAAFTTASRRFAAQQ